MANDPFKVIFTSAIPEITEVRYYAETEEKIRRKHPEVPINLPSIALAVEKAIANPTTVQKSYGKSFIYFDALSTNKSGDPMQVPVQLIEGTSARVRSVYFAEDEGDEEVVYRSKTDE